MAKKYIDIAASQDGTRKAHKRLIETKLNEDNTLTKKSLINDTTKNSKDNLEYTIESFRSFVENPDFNTQDFLDVNPKITQDHKTSMLIDLLMEGKTTPNHIAAYKAIIPDIDNNDLLDECYGQDPSLNKTIQQQQQHLQENPTCISIMTGTRSASKAEKAFIAENYIELLDKHLFDTTHYLDNETISQEEIQKMLNDLTESGIQTPHQKQAHNALTKYMQYKEFTHKEITQQVSDLQEKLLPNQFSVTSEDSMGYGPMTSIKFRIGLNKEYTLNFNNTWGGDDGYTDYLRTYINEEKISGEINAREEEYNGFEESDAPKMNAPHNEIVQYMAEQAQYFYEEFARENGTN